MRSNWTVALVPLALLVGACGRRDEQALPDDLKKDLAAASATGAELASASHGAKRMRFVSDIEQWKTSAPAHRPVAARHSMPRMMHSHLAPNPTTAVEEVPVTGVAAEAAPAEPAPAAISTSRGRARTPLRASSTPRTRPAARD